MKLIITGPRSVGKTTISKILAKKLYLKRIELDVLSNKMLQKQGGLDRAIKTNRILPLIKKSPRIIKEILKKDDILLELPGGAISSRRFEPYAKKIRRIIIKNTFVVGLLPFKEHKKSIELLFKRERNRDHFKKINTQELHLKVQENYVKIIEPLNEVANIIIFTENKKPSKIVKKIISTIEEVK